MLLISIIPNKNVILLSFCYIYHLCYHIPLYLKCNFYQIGDTELIFGTPTPSRGRSGKICSFEKIILQGSPVPIEVVRSLTAFEFVPRDKCVLIIPLRLACWVTVPPTQLPLGSVQVLRQHFFWRGEGTADTGNGGIWTLPYCQNPNSTTKCIIVKTQLILKLLQVTNFLRFQSANYN